MERTPGQLRLERVAARCRDAGMNLVCVVDAVGFDASQPCDRRASSHLPGAETILLLGTGGRAGWDAVRRRESARLQRPRRGEHPIDDWSEAVARDVLTHFESLGARGRVIRPDDPRTLNFRQLAEMGGIGVISPVLGHLLHPEFGPWVSLRAAVVLAGAGLQASATEPLLDFAPCNTCAKPCVTACPVGVYDGPRPDLLRCGWHRIEGGCATGCESLRACPVGAAHRYAAADEAWRQAHSLIRIRRWLGAGAWRLVPGFVRRLW